MLQGNLVSCCPCSDFWLLYHHNESSFLDALRWVYSILRTFSALYKCGFFLFSCCRVFYTVLMSSYTFLVVLESFQETFC